MWLFLVVSVDCPSSFYKVGIVFFVVEMKRTGVEKTMNKNGATSTSSSMEIPTGQNLTTDGKIRRGNSSKKMKRGESSNSVWGNETGAGQSQESSVKKTSMKNLPPEMLTKILKCVNSLRLFKCRLVNRQWNEISSGILRNRSNAFTGFEYNYGRFLWSKFRVAPYEERSLRDFVRCMKISKNCPFSHFSFWIRDETNPLKFFKEKELEEFTSYFTSLNQTIKSVKLVFDFVDDDIKMFHTFVPNLSDLLFNKIPRLEELTLDIRSSIEAPDVKLFHTLKQREVRVFPKSDVGAVQVQLPNLKVLRFESPMISPYTEMLKDFLNAAVNLKCLRMQIYSPEDFQFLHSLGKLHLLKEAAIEIDRDFISAAERDKNNAPLPFPELEFLELRPNVPKDDESRRIYFSRTTNFLGNLFESSKDTLTELHTLPFGSLTDLQLPTFTKLRTLFVIQFNFFPFRSFPHGIRTRDVFPAVSDLVLKVHAWDSAFPQEGSIPILPSVTSLALIEGHDEEINTAVVALMCPNLIKFKIVKHDQLEPKLTILQGVPSIWTYMTKLESLEFDIDLDLPENTSVNLDSCFTGISTTNCQHLCNLMEAKKTLENYGGSVDIPDSKLKALAQRQYPSILDLKDLKTLKINPYSENKLLKRMEFFTKLTWTSEEYAFKFLPHLKPKPTDRD